MTHTEQDRKVSDIIRERIEGIKRTIADCEADIITMGKKIAEAVTESNTDEIIWLSSQIQRKGEWVKRDKSYIETAEFDLQDAIRKESKLSAVAEALDMIFQKDMEFLKHIKEMDRAELKDQIKKKIVPASVMMFRDMSHEDAVKLFKRDIEDRFRAIERKIEDTVGEIIECKFVRNANGTLDGWVKGSQGGARVHTVGAGGYNIIRFHYRTLIKKWKND